MPSSCQSSTMFVHNFHRLSLRNSPKFRCVLDQIGPNPAVSSSLSSVFTSANLIAAAGSGSLHGAVTSTITQVAVTAVAIASGACLSTKVDFLWPKLETQPGCDIVEGVDVTGYPIFNDPKAGAKGYCICQEGSPWPITKNGRPLFSPLHPHRKNLGHVGSFRWRTICCRLFRQLLLGFSMMWLMTHVKVSAA